LVALAIGVKQLSEAGLLVVHSFPDEEVPILVVVLSLPVPQVVYPFALVPVLIKIDHYASALSFPFDNAS